MERRTAAIFGSIRNKLSRRDSSEVERSRSIQHEQLSYQQQAFDFLSNKPAHTPSSPPPRSPYRPRQPPQRQSRPHDPPPAYTPSADPAAPVAPSSTATPTYPHAPAPCADSPYAFLTTFDTHFLIDDSGSMAGRSWREVAAALAAIAPVCTAHDADGIDLSFLNHPPSPAFRNLRSPAAVLEAFSAVRPAGATPTGVRLHEILRAHVRAYAAAPDATRPLNVVVVTDGAASDDVESALVGCARRLDALDAPAWQVGVQFFQVGAEPGAAEMLRMLDDELGAVARRKGEVVRDMVDTVPFGALKGEGGQLSADGILKVVLGAVNRRLDRASL